MQANATGAARDYRDALPALYGERLRGVYVFGSVARGEEGSESDLDVLVVLDHVDDYWAEIERTSEVGADIALRHGIALSRVFLGERDWETGTSPFARAARRDAVAA